MDFDDFPSIYIQHKGKTHEFFTSSADMGTFVLALRHHFGADTIPDHKEIFLVTESKNGPDGQPLPPREAPLGLFLVNKAKSDRIFTLKFSDAVQTAPQIHPLSQARILAQGS
jgi:hypothetical protein